MTPEDRERMRANARAALERAETLNGMGGSPEYSSEERPYPDEILGLLADLESAELTRDTAAEHAGQWHEKWEAGYGAGIRNADHRLRLALEILDGRFQPTDRIGDLHAAMTNILKGEL